MRLIDKILFTVFFIFFMHVAPLKAQKKHIVSEGNTLSGLAKQYYGSYDKWTVIYEANKGKKLEVIDSLTTRKRVPNRLRSPKYIYPGQVLIIPDIPEDSIFTDTNTTEKPIEVNFKTDVKPRYNVSARVTSDRKALEGVNVQYIDAKGTLQKTMTNTEGDFTAMQINDGTTIEFSKEGYLPETAKVKAGRIDDVVLISQNQAVDSWAIKGTVKLRKKAGKTPKIAKKGTITIAGQSIEIQSDGTFEAKISNQGQKYLKVEGTDIKKYTVKENFQFEVSPTEKNPKPSSLEIILDRQ